MANLTDQVKTNPSFVASGAISNGDLVGINIDGTVSVVSSYLGSFTSFESSNSDAAFTYDTTNNKVIIAYRDGNNFRRGTAVVGTISGSSISFGTPVVFDTSDSQSIRLAYDSANQKVVIIYTDTGNSNYGTAIVGTVSGTSISFGSPYVFTSGSTDYKSIVYDSLNSKVVISFRDNSNSFYATSIVGTVSGTAISFGTPTVINGGEYGAFIDSVYDSTNNKVVVSYSISTSSSLGRAIVGTVSGTSISFGSAATVASTGYNYPSLGFDSTNGKVIIAYRVSPTVDQATAIVGTVSGTSISFGTPTVIEEANTGGFSVVHDPVKDVVSITYRYLLTPTTGRLAVCSVNGTSITVNGVGPLTTYAIGDTFSLFDPDTNQTISLIKDNSDEDLGTGVLFYDAANLTSFSNWIGFADSAISDGATGSVSILGSINTGQSGLLLGRKYYLQDDATITTTEKANREVGRSVSSTSILITQGSIKL